MKTLNYIQTLSKIGKILSKIVCICCAVGFIGSAVGAAAMLVGRHAAKIGGVTLHSILQTEAGITEGTIWAAISAGMILSVGEFFISRMAYRYFDNELTAGTPFTSEGAKELKHLGVSSVWISIVSVALAQGGQEVIAHFAENVETVSLDVFDSAAMGIMFIIVSLLCKHGAETVNKNR